MTANRRILLNTAASYARSVTGLVFGLWTGRWVLAALGEEDFGIYQMSGVCIVFFSFFSGVVSSSASRFFAFGFGKGQGETRLWFANAFWIHFAIAAAFLPISGFTGNLLFRHFFDIPAARMEQAIFAFNSSVVATFVSICTAPFLAMFLAKQEVFLQSFGIFAMSAAQCLAAWFLLRTHSDKLVYYAGVFAAIHIAYPIGMSCLALVRYPECRCFRDVERKRLRELLGFSLWNTLGPASGMIKSQGNAIAVNTMLGVRRNASIGVCRQLTAQANALSQSLMSALLPEIATSEGANRKERVRTLATNASILSTLLFSILAVPLSIEVEFALKTWLKTPPQHTGQLTACVLLGGLIPKFACGQGLVLNAKGKIREYQLTVAPIVAGSVIVSILGIWATRSIVWVGIAAICSDIGIAATSLFWGSKQAEIRVREWARTTLAPILKFLLPPMILGFVLHQWLALPSGFLRSILICAAVDCSILILAWRFSISTNLKNRIVKAATRFFVTETRTASIQ